MNPPPPPTSAPPQGFPNISMPPPPPGTPMTGNPYAQPGAPQPPQAQSSLCRNCCLHCGVPEGAGGMTGPPVWPSHGNSASSSTDSSPTWSPTMGNAASQNMFREMPTPPGALHNNAPPPFLPVRRMPKHRVKFSFCVFCKNNGEDERYYLGHTLKDDFGRVTCPILGSYQCPLCGASGPVAHTIKYCPTNKDDGYHGNFASITMLKQMKSSTGQLRALRGPGAMDGASGPAGGRYGPVGSVPVPPNVFLYPSKREPQQDNNF